MLKIPTDTDYYADARLYLSHIYRRQKKLAQAIVEATHVLGVKKDDLEVMEYLAGLERENGNRPRAIQILERMIGLAPTNDVYHFTLGAIYDEHKDKARCVAYMQKAIDLNPENSAALNYLGYTWAEQGIRLDEAEDLIRRALQVEPDDGFYIDSLGWVYYQRGEYPEAVEYLERAVELVNDDPTITEHLGDAYEKVGRIGDASRTYRAALDQATESDQHRRLRDKIDSLARPGRETRSSGLE